MEEDWGLRSVVDYLVGQCEALGSVCTTRNTKILDKFRSIKESGTS